MSQPNKPEISVKTIISVFNETFYHEYNTQLVQGDHEPLYLPADADCCFHQIIFAHGFVRSALHEVAHWLVAGAERRLQEDYGYWYEPDGRNEQQQAEFERVEVLPQAIEWALSVSCGVSFDVSSDNLSGIVINRLAFKKRVHTKVLSLLENGFSARTNQLLSAYQQQFNRAPLKVEDFNYQGMYQLV